MKSVVFAVAAIFCLSSVSFSADVKSVQAKAEGYSVQILLSEKHLQPENKIFKGVSDIQEEVYDGLFKYKYITGRDAKSFSEAAAIRLKMIEAGFTDAFVVRYRDGKRVVSKNMTKAGSVKPISVSSAARPEPSSEQITPEAAGAKTKVVIGSAVVQIKPEFPGGENALELFIKNNLHYPDPPLDKNRPAQVFVSFTVDFKGRIKNQKVVGGLNDESDKEALRVIGSMPAWEPGTIGGMPVNMDCFLPVDFHAPAEKQTAQSEGKK